MFNRNISRRSVALLPLLLLFGAAGQAFADPPSRVVRLSYLDGDVSMQPAGIEEWSRAHLNRPLISGDSLYTDRASRVEMEVGTATVRLDERSTFRLLNLDDANAQIELTAGTLSLNVRQVFEGQTYEIDTPTLALVIDNPGQYRIDISPQGDSTMISVIDGNGDVYGRDNASYRIQSGESYRFHDSQLSDYEVFDLPRQDDFDRWCYERSERYDRSPSRRYVSEDVIGYADLDDYGSWSSAPSYGSIWYPSRVDTGWTPYRDGHWSWIDPWGWTWVDDAPWGFAPSHYGRWANVNNRWGWVPGPRHGRSIYAPALVAFVGGGGFSVSISSGGPVGWFPLGPRDVYVPWYSGSRTYFNNINTRNTTIINNTYITNVYNDYSNGRPVTDFDYAYRNNRNAYTAVSHDAFVNARSVNSARVQVSQAQMTQGRVVSRISMAPTARSFVGGGEGRGNGRSVKAATFDRQVIARTAPPVRRLDAQDRIRAISRNNNQPLAVAEMRQLSAQEPRTNDRTRQRVEVVGGNRPSTTKVPARSGIERISRGGRVQPAESAVRGNDQQRVRTIAPAQQNRDINRTDTVRAPRTNSTERISPPSRAPSPSMRNDTSRSNPASQREESQRAPRAVSAPERRVSPAPVQRREIERTAPTSRSAPPATERSVPQRTQAPREADPYARREAQSRSAPQPQQRAVQPRTAPQQQEREVRSPSAPRSQVPEQVQRAPVNTKPQPRQRKTPQKDDPEDDGNQRRRRE